MTSGSPTHAPPRHRLDPHRCAIAVVLAKAGSRGVGTLSELERRIYEAAARPRGRDLAAPDVFRSPA